MTDQEIAQRVRDHLQELNDPEWNYGCLRDVTFCNGILTMSNNGYTWRLNVRDLLTMANAIDGCIDAMKAMIRDLQEESAAYQRGVEEGKRQQHERLVRRINNYVVGIRIAHEDQKVVDEVKRELFGEYWNEPSIDESLAKLSIEHWLNAGK